ncbi:phosphatidate cytidylyltransferase [Desulfovibrio sp. OttesenSCG-928-G15]|nr:phosphatidate cytidylyltransferase [Desulfovibrio sp. OttesenSCG-928-G15]
MKLPPLSTLSNLSSIPKNLGAAMAKYTPHQQRLITGLCLVVALVLLLAAGGWLLRLAAVLVACAGMHELLAMFWPGETRTRSKNLGLVLAGLIVLSQAFGGQATLAVSCMAFWAVAMTFLFDYGRGNTEARLEHYAPIAFGLLYIPMVLQFALYFSPPEQCLVILAAIASDVGGYYAGNLFGKRKLWPLVSPKKTWEGLAGGLLLCVVVCASLGYCGAKAGWPLPAWPVAGWILVALLLHQAALFGDFFESALKRGLNVKDSGTLLPGHGGILDRIDSILFCVAMYALLRAFF